MPHLPRLYCAWFGCEPHPLDFNPPDQVRCRRCHDCISYSDLVGDTRHYRFMERLSVLWRWWPRKCPDCGQWRGHSNDCIPF